MTSGTCASCGDVVDHLVEVHRHYVTPEAWDTERRVHVVAEPELWCLVCRTHYPHEVRGTEG